MTNMSSDRRVLHQLSRLLHLFAESLMNIQSSCVQMRCDVIGRAFFDFNWTKQE